MLAVKIPSHAYYQCTTYLEHNFQFPNREYYITRVDDHYELSFPSKDRYLAFCYRWSSLIL